MWPNFSKDASLIQEQPTGSVKGIYASIKQTMYFRNKVLKAFF